MLFEFFPHKLIILRKITFTSEITKCLKCTPKLFLFNLKVENLQIINIWKSAASVYFDINHLSIFHEKDHCKNFPTRPHRFQQ